MYVPAHTKNALTPRSFPKLSPHVLFVILALLVIPAKAGISLSSVKSAL